MASPKVPERQTGVCKWFDMAKGYGFIKSDKSGDDLFVHYSAVKGLGFRTLNEGEQLEFERVVDENGRSKAVNVTGPSGASVKGAPPNNNRGGGSSSAGGYQQQQQQQQYPGGGYKQHGRDYGNGGERSYGGGASGNYGGSYHPQHQQQQQMGGCGYGNDGFNNEGATGQPPMTHHRSQYQSSDRAYEGDHRRF